MGTFSHIIWAYFRNVPHKTMSGWRHIWQENSEKYWGLLHWNKWFNPFLCVIVEAASLNLEGEICKESP